MEIKRYNQFGHYFLNVKNNADLEITLSAFGASVYSIKYKNKTVTYHPESIVEFLSSDKYYGKTLGRVCGRIKDGVVKIKGETYNLDKNENGNTLHGGFKNLSFVDFAVEVTENDEYVNVVFKYTSPEFECGFPSDVRFIVIYIICKNNNKFIVHYHAHPSSETPINMSSHIYWRLGDTDILDHELFIDASENTVMDQKTLVTKGKQKIAPLFDFKKPKAIRKDIFQVAKEQPGANGYDHGFIFDKSTGSQIVLKNDNTMLSIKTDMNMVNIYTNNYPKGGPIKDYGPDIIYGGVAIEPQMFYTSYKDLICTPDHPFDHYFSFTLEDVK